MNIVRGLPFPSSVQHPVVTIGNFDGQHGGHLALLKVTLDVAHQTGGTPVVLTFDPHPIQVLKPDVRLQFLSTLEQKLQWFKEHGVELAIVLEFSRNFAQLTPEQFAIQILQQGIGARAVVVGSHFVFGAKRAGSIDDLRQLGQAADFHVHAVLPVHLEDEIASSTRIRQLIQHGHVYEASRYLGRPYMLSGQVVEGAHRGEELGCRTANLHLPASRAIPADGIYATILEWKHQAFYTVSYIGTRPTFGSGERILEVHVLDQNIALYGESIHVHFIQWIRGDEKFTSSQDLARQMSDDVRQARRILETAPFSRTIVGVNASVDCST